MIEDGDWTAVIVDREGSISVYVCEVSQLGHLFVPRRANPWPEDARTQEMELFQENQIRHPSIH